MVGVPGKYKGCETCRLRRVKVRWDFAYHLLPPPPHPGLLSLRTTTNKIFWPVLQCSNERPYCQKCIKSGRQCEGYERERVFITGTPENRGRVASHPKKTASLSSSSARRQRLKVETGSTPEFTTPERTPEPQGPRSFQGLAAAPPLASAWDDYITLRRSQGSDCYALLTALQAPLRGISSSSSSSGDAAAAPGDSEAAFRIALAPYTPPGLPTMTGNNMFDASARCLVHLSSADGGEEPAQSFCVFLSEVRMRILPNPHVHKKHALGNSY